MRTYLLAIDGGSQSTKVSVVDDRGEVHASGQQVLRAYTVGPHGRAVHPDDDLWDSLRGAARQALDAFTGDPRAIVAVGLCGIRSCRALMDEDGRLTESVLSWMDPRVTQPLGQTDPAVATVASAGGYLTVRLTGERRDSAASYVGMWPIDPTTRGWSEDPAELDRTQMPRGLLPELVDPGELLGRVTDVASAGTGIPAGLPVYATANDKAVEALGCGLLTPGPLLLSLGTYIAAMTVGEKPVTGREGYWVNAAAVPGQHLYESDGIRRGMWTVSWLRGLVSSAAPDLVDPLAVQEWLNEGAQDVSPGCGGLMTVPDWLAPPSAPHRRGAIIGLDGSHGPGHLHRSILEGIALTMRGHIQRMESALGRRLEPMRVSGGGSRAEVMMQIIADVFGRPVERAAVADAAGVGAAICAAVGHGVHPGFEEAATAMTRPGDTFTPDPAAQDDYDRIFETYASLSDFTEPMLKRISRSAAG